MMIAPVLANLGPLEEFSFKPNPGEVQPSYFLFSFYIHCKGFHRQLQVYFVDISR